MRRYYTETKSSILCTSKVSVKIQHKAHLKQPQCAVCLYLPLFLSRFQEKWQMKCPAVI